jgi:carboxyl-terminal processing protease
VDLDRFGISDDHRAGRLKLTIAKFYRVTGASTQRMGVKPDIGLPSSTDDEDVGETAAPNALPWDQISSVSYHQAGNLQDILPVLQSRHHERMAHSAALKALGKEFDLIRKQQHDTDVSLNEADRRAHQKAQEKARLAAVNKRLAAYGRPPVDSLDDLDEDSLPDTLLNEAAEVMADMRAVESDTATASAAKTAETGAQ